MNNEFIKTVPKGILHDRDKANFGHCLHKKHENFYANIGKDNWYYCPICKIKWLIGFGLFSDPDFSYDELIKLWLSNEKMLESYEDLTDSFIFCNKKDLKEWELEADFFK